MKNGNGKYLDTKGNVVIQGVWKKDIYKQPQRFSSGPSQKPCNFYIINKTPFHLEIYWVDFQRKLKSYGKIFANKTQPMGSYVTHNWEAHVNGIPISSFSIRKQNDKWLISWNGLLEELTKNKRLKSK